MVFRFYVFVKYAKGRENMLRMKMILNASKTLLLEVAVNGILLSIKHTLSKHCFFEI